MRRTGSKVKSDDYDINPAEVYPPVAWR